MTQELTGNQDACETCQFCSRNGGGHSRKDEVCGVHVMPHRLEFTQKKNALPSPARTSCPAQAMDVLCLVAWQANLCRLETDARMHVCAGVEQQAIYQRDTSQRYTEVKDGPSRVPCQARARRGKE